MLYRDMVATIADRKRAVSDLSKWTVTVQGLIVGFVGLQQTAIENYFAAAPILVGSSALALNRALHLEPESHRRTVANLRHEVGGPFLALTREMVDHYRGQRAASEDYWSRISANQVGIVLLSTVVATACVLLTAA